MKKILDFSVKDFILFVTQIIAILFFIAVIILLVGADTFYFRSVITLIPIGIALVGARIAYKNYQAGQSERRNIYLKGILIDSIPDTTLEFKLLNSSFDIKFTLKNFPYELIAYNAKILSGNTQTLLNNPNGYNSYEGEKLLLINNYQSYLKSIKYLLYQGIQRVNRIVQDEMLLPNHKEELLEMLVNKLFLGYLEAFEDLYPVKLDYIKGNKKEVFDTKVLHSKLLPNKEDFKKAFGTYYTKIIENGRQH